MKKFAIMLLAAVMLMPSAPSLADQSTGATPKPSSFVPHAHSNSHVYGSPLQPAGVSHSNVSHHKHTPKKPASTPKK
jgi:hypothetical protein